MEENIRNEYDFEEDFGNESTEEEKKPSGLMKKLAVGAVAVGVTAVAAGVGYIRKKRKAKNSACKIITMDPETGEDVDSEEVDAEVE